MCIRDRDIIIHAVDIWQGVPIGQFWKNVKLANCDKIIKPIKKDSADTAADFKDGSVDFVFVDADHSYDACNRDIVNWLPKLKEKGWMAGHDYFEGAVIKAVRNTFGKGVEGFWLARDEGRQIQNNCKSWLVKDAVERVRTRKYLQTFDEYGG